MISPNAFIERARATRPEAPKQPTAEPLCVSDEEGRVAGNCKCNSCMGTGKHIRGFENDRPVFSGGHCFRCEGKGYHTQADRKRNYGYNFHRRVA